VCFLISYTDRPRANYGNRLDIELADVVLRRPSLDDVFLSLTGDAASDRSTERVAGEVFS